MDDLTRPPLESVKDEAETKTETTPDAKPDDPAA